MNTDNTTVGSTPAWQTIRALLAEDARLFRVQIISTVLLGIACYVIIMASNWDEYDDSRRLQFLGAAAGMAMVVTAMMGSAFAGAAIAGERYDRSSDFMAMMPVTRRQILFSKQAITFAVLIGLSVVHLFIARYVSGPGHRTGSINWQQDSGMPRVLQLWAGGSICFFGVAWLCSVWTKTSVISATVGIAITVAATLFASLWVESLPNPRPIEESTASTLLAGSIGILCWMAGTISYLWQTEP